MSGIDWEYVRQQEKKFTETLGNNTPLVRKFETGATRDVDTNKYDYEGFLSPLVLDRFAEYMHKHRVQPDGNLRDSDNWQKGIPKVAYMKSAYRHFLDWWRQHRGLKGHDLLEESICALLFNAMGYLHELLKEKHENRKPDTRMRELSDAEPVPAEHVCGPYCWCGATGGNSRRAEQGRPS